MLSLPKDISPTTLTLYSLRSVGLLVQRSRPWLYIFTIYHLVVMNTMIITIVLELFISNPSIQEVVQAFSWLTICIHIYGKFVNILCHQNEIRQLLDKLEEIRNEILQDHRDRHILIDSDDLLMKVIKYFYILFVSYPFASLFFNLIGDYITGSKKPHLLVKAWIPWSMEKFWPYLGGMFYVTIFPITTTVVYATLCIYLFTFTFQISAFVKVIRARLETDGPNDKNIYRKHTDIIQLIQEYNKLFSGQQYFEIFISSLQPCGFGYTFIKTMKRNDPGAFDLIYKSLLGVSAPFTICACGQVIRSQIEKLHISAYMGKWYEERPIVRKDLVTLMTVTVKPMTFTFRKFVVFDFVCYAAVLQGIYSYFMMISQFDF